jgi:CRP/FNR family cyclic AMP-dependent transcriptional regulator
MVDYSFDDGYVQALAALGTVRSYAKHTILIQEGDKTDQIYAVLSGKLKVYLAESVREGRIVIRQTLPKRW